MTDSTVYLNGDFLPLAEAKIPVLDRGFIFGDGIYEVVPVYERKLFRFREHLARLGRSLAKLRILNPRSDSEWLELSRLLVTHCFDRTNAVDQLVYIQVSRGVAPRDHVMPPDLTPTVFAMANPMKPPTVEQRTTGVACVTAVDFRWERGDIKSTSLLGNVLARQISADAGAVETILFRDGWLTEASASNVWIAVNGGFVGVPQSGHVLEGIRYGLFEELCRSCGIRHSLRPIHRDEFFAAEEVMLSSATKELLPVTTVDDRTIGKGIPGPVAQRLHTAYQEAKRTMGI
jgi:D-alanine transaminase